MFGGDLLGDAVSPNPNNQLDQLNAAALNNSANTSSANSIRGGSAKENRAPELIRLDRDFERKQRISDETVVRNLELMGEEHNACWGVIKNLTQQIRTCGSDVEVKNG